MRERPILFSTPMIQAILAGRKTQTRRIVKPQPTVCDDKRGGHWWPSNAVQSMVHVEDELQDYEGPWAGIIETCNPYGQIGDQLWVRESWYHKGEIFRSYPDAEDDFYFSPQKKAAYVADGKPPKDWTVRKRPSIHMPRWASRIQLEITNIRFELLNDISEADALAEGCIADPCDHARQICEDIECCGPTAKGHFKSLWESINGPGSWSNNPWVWVVEFKVIQGGKA